MSSQWFDKWGILEEGSATDEPTPAIKIYESDIIGPGLSFGARICNLALRFLACHDHLKTYNRESLGRLLDVEAQTVGRWIHELNEAQATEDYRGTWVDVSDDSYVYFVQAASGGPIKIGISNDPLGRLAQLQTGHPGALVILAVVPGGRQLELDLHKKFAKHRIHGEWFSPTPELLEIVGNADKTARHQHLTER